MFHFSILIVMSGNEITTYTTYIPFFFSVPNRHMMISIYLYLARPRPRPNPSPLRHTLHVGQPIVYELQEKLNCRLCYIK